MAELIGKHVQLYGVDACGTVVAKLAGDDYLVTWEGSGLGIAAKDALAVRETAPNCTEGLASPLKIALIRWSHTKHDSMTHEEASCKVRAAGVLLRDVYCNSRMGVNEIEGVLLSEIEYCIAQGREVKKLVEGLIGELEKRPKGRV